MKTFFIICFCALSGLSLGAIAGNAMIMALSIDLSAGAYIGALQGAIVGLLCSPLFVLKKNHKNIFAIMVMCFVLTFPVAVISGFTINPWLSIGLSVLSYLSIYYLSVRGGTHDENDIFRKIVVYIVPIVCLVIAAIAAYSHEDKSLPRDIPSLIEMMGDNDIGRQMAAARKLKSSGKAPFLTALNHKNPRVRATAAHFLGLLNDTSVQNVLIESSKDADPYVRMWTAFSLGRIGDLKALPVLNILADDKEEIVRRRAITAIENIRKREGKQ